jgi:hypothetical protein
LRPTQAVIVLHDSFRARTTHRGAEQQLLDLRRFGVIRQVVPDQCVRENLKLLQIERLVEFSLWRRRNVVQAKPERAGTVVRRLQEIVQLAKQCLPACFSMTWRPQ